MTDKQGQEHEQTTTTIPSVTSDPIPLTVPQEPQGALSMQDALVALVDHAGEPSSPQQPFIIPDIAPLQGEITTAPLNTNINPPPLDQQDGQATGIKRRPNAAGSAAAEGSPAKRGRHERGRPSGTGVCKHCGQPGHNSRTCAKHNGGVEITPPPTKKLGKRGKSNICSVCKGLGHNSRTCPQRAPESATTPIPISQWQIGQMENPIPIQALIQDVQQLQDAQPQQQITQ